MLFCTYSDDYNRPFLISAAIIIIILSFIRIIMEIVQIYSRIYSRKFYYFFEFKNCLVISSLVSSIIFVTSYGFKSGCQCPVSWQWQFGAFSLLISWMSLILVFKQIRLTGIYVEMLIHIVFTFSKLFVFAALLVISFGLTFYMIFFRPVSQVIYVVAC